MHPSWKKLSIPSTLISVGYALNKSSVCRHLRFRDNEDWGGGVSCGSREGSSRLLLRSRSSGEEKSATSSRLDIRWLVELKRGRRLSNSNFNNSAPYACNFNGATRLLLNYASIPGHLSTYQPRRLEHRNCQLFKFYIQFRADRNLITVRLARTSRRRWRGGGRAKNFLWCWWNLQTHCRVLTNFSSADSRLQPQEEDDSLFSFCCTPFFPASRNYNLNHLHGAWNNLFKLITRLPFLHSVTNVLIIRITEPQHLP